MHNQKIIFLFLNQKYVVGTKKSRLFEHQKQMFKLMDKKMLIIWRPTLLFIWGPC